MKLRSALVASAALACAGAGPSLAQTAQSLQRQLQEISTDDQAQIRALQAQIDALKGQLSQQDQKLSADAQRAEAARLELSKDVQAARKSSETGSGLTWNGVTLYGIIDVGAAYLSHGAPAGASFSPSFNYLVRPYGRSGELVAGPNGLSISRIGLKGTEPLSDQWSFVFALEDQFIPTSGETWNAGKALAAQNGVPVPQRQSGDDSSRFEQAFNAAAYGGISNPVFGTLTFGRQNTLSNDLVTKYDPFNGAQAFGYIGWDGTAAGMGRTQTARFDNSAKYRVNIGPAHFGAVYRSSVSGAASAPGYQLNLGGEYDGISVDALYGKIHDVIQAAALSAAQVVSLLPGIATTANAPTLGPSLLSTTLAGTVSDNEGYGAMASYIWDKLTFTGGYEHITFRNPVHPLPAGSPDYGFTLGVVNNAAYTIPKIYEIYWLGARYQMTPQLRVVVSYNRLDQHAFGTAADRAKCAIDTTLVADCKGGENSYSVALIYSLSKRFDVYGGAMLSNVEGGTANGYAPDPTNEFTPMMGVRFSF
jgi:predicted porin